MARRVFFGNSIAQRMGWLNGTRRGCLIYAFGWYFISLLFPFESLILIFHFDEISRKMRWLMIAMRGRQEGNAQIHSYFAKGNGIFVDFNLFIGKVVRNEIIQESYFTSS